MKFEELTLENLGEIIPFYVEAFNAPPWNDKWTEETVRKRLTQMINCEGFYGLICIYNGEKVGMILGNDEHYYDGLHFNIKEFCVDKKIKGKGLGKRLLKEFTARLKNKGVDNIYLLTSRTDETEGFYRSQGYKTLEHMAMMEIDLR
ncbi:MULTISPECIES: GNAT family N-acetyltransferase [Clostridium]|uniref:GNAT family N-acetyltransferase n=1 Tax=Clostridium nitritogenes TaxID=83340 RepID=A0ABP3X4A2_9CLOT|nr:GNAT family N-acetyltransferase [Clostridium baratii]MBT9831201.1 GNAT family N-acetyltransferase [Clostridium baratii]MDY3206273.1 GNAT family N-acetyltransferase [Clostridium baratii]STB00420.1 N-acetyltransferase GCN5 [Clostridium baratii]